MNKEVDEYFSSLDKWQKEIATLRQIIADCGLMEDFKWKHPCYTYKDKNILLLHGFKDYCAVLFNKGALLNDSNSILIQQTENTQSARQIRFASLSEIITQEKVIKEYIFEAIEIEKAGLKITKKTTSDFSFPIELSEKFKAHPELEFAFNNLTEGRKRGYLLHFSQAKQTQTKIARIEKNTVKILKGQGLNDCTCGLTKRKPNCDGSHKQLKKQ